MRTVKAIQVGRRYVVGQVYIGESKERGDSFLNAGVFLDDVQPVASSAAGCHAMADALREMGAFIREHGNGSG